MQAYRLTGESKVEDVCDFLETLCDAGAKFLIFAYQLILKRKSKNLSNLSKNQS